MAVIRNAPALLRAVDGVLQRLGPVLLAAHCLKHALLQRVECRPVDQALGV